MDVLEKIGQSLEKGNTKETRNYVIEALGQGFSHEEILARMLEVMEKVGRAFKVNQLFVPEVLIIGRAFNVALEVLSPLMLDEMSYKGTLVIGTVKGDMHDVGKNLVKMLLGSTGIRVIDLGIDVSPESFVEAVRTYKPDMLAMSALLTTTMVQMNLTIKALEKADLRKDLKIFIGGAPVTSSYAENVGADFFAPDAGSAADIVRKFLLEKSLEKSVEA